MGIKRVEVNGFRSLKNVAWEPGPLNVLIGPNGSGKSNLLRALELLSQAAQGRLEEAVEQSRGIRALSWNYASEASLSWHVQVQPDQKPKECVEYILGVESFGQYGDFRVRNEVLWRIGGRGKPIRVFGREYQEAYSCDDSGTKIPSAPLEKPHQLLLTGIGYPPSAAKLAEQVRGILTAWKVYQEIPVGQASQIRRSATARRVDVVESDGQNLVSVIHTFYSENEAFRQAIDDAMNAAFGDDFREISIAPAEDTRVQVRIKWNSLTAPQSAADLSDGMLRFLALLTILTAPNPPPLIAIDEPETGLHPSMLPIIAEYAVEASRKTQVILTTHSPEFLDAFRETVPKVTVAFWENGQTVLKTPPEDVLKHWLKQYTLGSLMRSGELENEAQ